MSITNGDLFRVLRPEGSNKFKEAKAAEAVLLRHCKDKVAVKFTCRRYVSRLMEKWSRHKRTERRFLKHEKKWLQSKILLSTSTNAKKQGRPKVEQFSELSERGKRKRITMASVSMSGPELAYAAGMKLRADGHSDSAKVLKQIAASPDIDVKSTRQSDDSGDKPRRATAEAAIGLLAECDLSKATYVRIRQFCKDHGADILPPYDDIVVAKKKCYPADESIVVTEIGASISLQGILDKTAERLLELQAPVINILPNNASSNLYVKGGFDGSSMHKTYKQAKHSANAQAPLASTSTILFTAIVAIRLTDESGRQVLWQNRSPNSGLSCRPVKFQDMKETPENILKEWQDLSRQTTALAEKKITMNGKVVNVRFKVAWTMFDGKLKAQLASSSAQSCNLCGAKPSALNNIPRAQSSRLNSSALQLGLSPLHSLLRFFSLVMSIACRLVLAKPTWQVRGKANQGIVDARKREIQTKFREEMGLLVDVPLTGGVGNTTDGNTARRAFDDPEKFARTTGVSHELLKRFAIILLVLRCSFEVNPLVFKEYCHKTAELYVSLYGSWYYMPSTVHEILLHGWKMMEELSLPPGLLSEEALESRTKQLRAYRLHHTRKSSHLNTNTDLLYRLILTSDPVVHSRYRKTKPGKTLPVEALSLLKSPEWYPHVVTTGCEELDESPDD